MIPEADMRELSAALDAIEQEQAETRPQGTELHEAYAVDRVLKDAPSSRTELVHDPASPGTAQVRKTFDAEAGLGGAYVTVMHAQRQGRAMAHLPRLREYSLRDGMITVVRDYVPGETLAQMAAQHGPSIALALRVMSGLCDAVQELHDLPGGPVIHRDIKPSNIVVSDDRVVLIDLGIARVYREGTERDTVRFGTPGFAPPEQYGFGQTDRASDIYALGMVLYFCLTGKEPGTAARSKGFREARIPESLSQVIARAASFDPARRYGSAQELKAAFLAACEAGEDPHETDGVPATAGLATRPRAPRRFPRNPGKTARIALRIWDALLFCVWALFFYVGILAIVDPQPADQMLPTWFLVLEYAGIAIAGCTLVLFPFAYKPRLRARFPRLGRMPWWKELLLCWGLAVGIVVAISIVYQLAVAPA